VSPPVSGREPQAAQRGQVSLLNFSKKKLRPENKSQKQNHFVTFNKSFEIYVLKHLNYI